MHGLVSYEMVFTATVSIFKWRLYSLEILVFLVILHVTSTTHSQIPYRSDSDYFYLDPEMDDSLSLTNEADDEPIEIDRPGKYYFSPIPRSAFFSAFSPSVETTTECETEKPETEKPEVAKPKPGAATVAVTMNPLCTTPAPTPAPAPAASPSNPDCTTISPGGSKEDGGSKEGGGSSSDHSSSSSSTGATTQAPAAGGGAAPTPAPAPSNGGGGNSGGGGGSGDGNGSSGGTGGGETAPATTSAPAPAPAPAPGPAPAPASIPAPAPAPSGPVPTSAPPPPFVMPPTSAPASSPDQEAKAKELRTLVQHLYIAQARVQLEAVEIKKAQAVANSAQQQLEEAANHVRAVTAALQNAQQEVAAAAIRAQTSQLQLAAHDQLLFAARQDVDALSSQMVGLQAAEGISAPTVKFDIAGLLEKLKQPLPDVEKPTAVPPVVPMPSIPKVDDRDYYYYD